MGGRTKSQTKLPTAQRILPRCHRTSSSWRQIARITRDIMPLLYEPPFTFAIVDLFPTRTLMRKDFPMTNPPAATTVRSTPRPGRATTPVGQTFLVAIDQDPDTSHHIWPTPLATLPLGTRR